MMTHLQSLANLLLAGDQAPPALYRPVWHVGHLVYKAGNPALPRADVRGGGFFPFKDFAGREQPSYSQYATPVGSATGGGFAPTRPNFLTSLAGPTSAQGL